MFADDYFYRKRGIKNSNAICFHSVRNVFFNKLKFSEDFLRIAYDIHTMAYVMMQDDTYYVL